MGVIGYSRTPHLQKQRVDTMSGLEIFVATMILEAVLASIYMHIYADKQHTSLVDAIRKHREVTVTFLYE